MCDEKTSGGVCELQMPAADIRAVIFDMDGVLLDTETVCDRTWKIAAREFNHVMSNDLINSCRGTNINDTINILSKCWNSEIAAQRFVARTSELFHEIETSEGLPKKPFVDEILNYLKERGYKIALASSTRGESVRRQLAASGIIDFFETLTTGDMVKHSKPDPEIYRMAAASINVNPENCVAVEDSPHGITSAVEAGMRCIMVPDKIAPNEKIRKITWHVCDNLADLKDIL